MHAGQFEEGRKQVERAIAINPDAHFGREVYQKMLADYVLRTRKRGVISLPLDRYGGRLPDLGGAGFGSFVLKVTKAGDDAKARDEELRKATMGVLGMMRFANYESPILLEALGDLLRTQGYPSDAKQLAARAYLKASYGVQDDAVRDAYRAAFDSRLAPLARQKA